MISHTALTNIELRSKLRRREICFGGNLKLKIYGKLNCKSGKRMKKENRVFFNSLSEAIDMGFRPCGHCMKNDYINWKNGSV